MGMADSELDTEDVVEPELADAEFVLVVDAEVVSVIDSELALVVAELPSVFVAELLLDVVAELVGVPTVLVLNSFRGSWMVSPELASG